MPSRCNRPSWLLRSRQRGVAAIEFAFIGVFMVFMLLGISVFWYYLQAQQSVTRAAGDGARSMLGLIEAGRGPCHPSLSGANRGAMQGRMEQVVLRSLEQSTIPGMVSQALTVSAIDWGGACSAGNASFEVRYKLPPMFGSAVLGLTGLTELYEKSVVHFAPSP